MNSMIKFATFVIVGLCAVFSIGFTPSASAQQRIAPPADATPVCLALFNELYADGSISMSDATRLTGYCIDSNRTMIGFYENLYDTLNGSAGAPHFANMSEANAAFTMCRNVEVCPRVPNVVTPREPNRLVVEGRGAVARYEGRGNNRRVVCEAGTVPFDVEERYAVVDGEHPRRRERNTTYVIVYCLDPRNSAAPGIAEREGRVDLTEIYLRLERLENACGEGGMRTPGDGNDSDWDLLCDRFVAVLIHTEQLRDLTEKLRLLTERMTLLEGRVEDLEDDAAADCGLTREEWVALSREERRQLHESGECDPAASASASASATGNRWLKLHVGAGLLLVGFTEPAALLAPHAIVSAELVALPSKHVGFFLRGFIGAGSLTDRRGQFNSAGTIGAEGVFGGSVGLTLQPISVFALDLGVAASAGFNPGDKVGDSIHSWPWNQIGGELRARVMPTSWFYVDATIGVANTHAELRQSNATTFTGVNAVGYSLSLTAGFHF